MTVLDTRFSRITNSVGQNHLISHQVFAARIIDDVDHPDDDPPLDIWHFPRQYIWEPMNPGDLPMISLPHQTSDEVNGVPTNCRFDVEGNFNYAYNTQEFLRDPNVSWTKIQPNTPVIMFIAKLNDLDRMDPCTFFINTNLQLPLFYFYFTQWCSPHVVVCDPPDKP